MRRPRPFLPQRRRCRPLRRASVAAVREPRVDPEVRQAVGLRVPLPRNVLVAHATEVLRDRTHLGVQPLERWVLDAVAARQLLDQQTAVGAEEHVGGSELLGLAEPLARLGVLYEDTSL